MNYNMTELLLTWSPEIGVDIDHNLTSSIAMASLKASFLAFPRSL